MNNAVLIITILIFLLSMLDGLKRGFIKIVASFAATIVTIVVVIVATPYVSNVLGKVLPIESIIMTNCMEIIFPEKNMNKMEFEEMLPTIDLGRDEQIQLIENSKLPEAFKELILENNNAEIYESLGVTNFGEYMVEYFAKLVVNILSFLLTFLVVTIVLRTIIYMLGIIGDLPVIGGLNRVAGAALGTVKGLIIVWVIFAIITLVYDTQLGEVCMQSIQEHEFLKFIYDNNVLLNYMVKFRG